MFRISCPTRVRPAVRRSVQLFFEQLNACPPEGPEALQACSLFQGSKAWLEPRLEPAETHPALPGREAPFWPEQAYFSLKNGSRGAGFDEQGVNRGPTETAGRAEGGHAAQKGCRALPCRVIAPDRASRPAPTDLTLVRLRRLSRGATVNGSPQHRRSSAAIEDWPVHGCCASPGTARTWRTTLQASCSDSVRLGVQRHRQSALPGGGNRVQRRQRALNAH